MIMSDDLDLRVQRPLRAPPESDWASWTSEGKAISYMLNASALQDKAIAVETGIDPATLSRAQTGQARLSEMAMNQLMDTCGSEAWLLYWLLKRGYDPTSLRHIETTLQRRVRELEERLSEVEHEREVELRLYAKLRSA
jgi:hypothetical protein